MASDGNFCLATLMSKGVVLSSPSSFFTKSLPKEANQSASSRSSHVESASAFFVLFLKSSTFSDLSCPAQLTARSTLSLPLLESTLKSSCVFNTSFVWRAAFNPEPESTQSRRGSRLSSNRLQIRNNPNAAITLMGRSGRSPVRLICVISVFRLFFSGLNAIGAPQDRFQLSKPPIPIAPNQRPKLTCPSRINARKSGGLLP